MIELLEVAKQMFQFQYGTIKSKDALLFLRYHFKFQFQYGTIKR